MTKTNIFCFCACTVLFIPRVSLGQCNGSSPTWTTSPDSASVQACVNNASPGDRINISAGTATWTMGVSISKPLSLVGPGATSLTVTDNVNNNAGITINVASGEVRISSFTWAAGSSLNCSSTCPNYSILMQGGSTQFRVDNITFATGWGGHAHAILGIDGFGVVDHNTFTDSAGIFVYAGASSYQGVGSYGDNSWAQPDAYGTANALYLENNTITGTSGTGIAATDCATFGGCRIVVRYNTLNMTNVQNHGTESPGRPRGGRLMEVYNNQFITNETYGQNQNSAVNMRSGTGLMWGNTFSLQNGSSFDGWSEALSVLLERASSNQSVWGTCDGTGPYDQNDGTVYASGTYTGSSGPQSPLTDTTKSWATNQWVPTGAPFSARNTTAAWGEEITSNSSTTATLLPDAYTTPVWTNGDSYQILRAAVCIDQIGRGQGNLLSGSTPIPTGWVQDNLDPVYLFNNSYVPMYIGVVSSNTLREISNRDYYYECSSQNVSGCSNSNFNGTSGTGTGLLANLPSTCSSSAYPGPAYWATDANGGNGELYICAAANTWTPSYTPYTYPHPLTNLTTSGTVPSAPGNLTATVQ